MSIMLHILDELLRLSPHFISENPHQGYVFNLDIDNIILFVRTTRHN